MFSSGTHGRCHQSALVPFSMEPSDGFRLSLNTRLQTVIAMGQHWPWNETLRPP